MHRDGRVKVGWFHQHQIEALDPTDTPLEIIRRAMPDDSEILAPLAAGPVRPRLRQGSRPRSPTSPAASGRACC